MIGTLLLAVWCAGLVPQAQAQAQAPRDARPGASAAGTASITGVVESDEVPPKPLRRAVVTLNGGALPVGRTVITADDGTFGFNGLPAGRYALGATKPGYVAINSGSARPAAPIAFRAMPNAGLSLADGESRRVMLRLPRGAVLSGMVTDGDGQPVKDVTMVALRYRFVAQIGQRLLGPSGQIVLTDDRGMYRIYGLPGGDYVVEAQPAEWLERPGPDIWLTSSGLRRVTVVPVFFPSTTDVSRASRVTVAAGEERDGVDIQMQHVPAATISGVLPLNPGSIPGTLSLIRQSDFGTEFVGAARAAPDGQFLFTGIAPGHYTLIGRSQTPPQAGGSVPPSGSWTWGSVDIAVDGDDLSDVAIPMAPAFSISGRIVFDGAKPSQELSPLRVLMPISTIVVSGIPSPSLKLLDGGRFTISGLAPGAYRIDNPSFPGIRAPIAGWWLKSIAIDGRELLDSVLDLRQGSEDAVITLADQASEISGTLRDLVGAPVSGVYVVAFSADRAAWFLNSRRVAGVRPDSQGRYAIRNLPPGEYRIVATGDIDPGDWFDPTVLERLLPAASAITVAGVEKTTRDFVVR